MKLVRDRFIRLDDEHDRKAAREAGLKIKQEPLGNWPKEKPHDVVEVEQLNRAQGLITQLNSRACALRTRAKRTATTS